MQEYSDIESSRVYSYFRLCVDYCMLDTKRDNITVKDLSDGKTLFRGRTGVETSFSDFVYGKVRKGLLKIPAKL